MIAVDIDQRCSILELASPFTLLSRQEQERFAAGMTECFLRTGDTLFERGDPGDAFYVVASGRARVIGQDSAGREISLSVLKRGEHFGEIALLSEVPRTATVRAAEDLVLLRLDRRDFLNFLAEHPHVRVALERYLKDFSMRDFLRQFTALSAVPAALLRQVIEQLEERSIAPGTIVVREGEPADSFYIVREGMLQAVRRENGAERVVNAIGPGEFFGEFALANGTARTATVIARSETKLYALSRQAFEKIVEGSPEFRNRIEHLASSYTRRAAPVEPPPGAIAEFGAEDSKAQEDPASRLASPQPGWRRFLRAYPFVEQHDETDCGAACLAMITKFYGVPVGVARLRDLANTDQDGASMWSMAQAAETLGFHARGLQLSYDALTAILTPAIVLWEGFHYIVLYEIGDRHVIVGDPGIGIRKLPLDEFRRKWSGRALELTPTDRLKHTRPVRHSYRRFTAILQPYRGLMAEVFAASMVLNLFGLAVPLFTQVIIDRVVGQHAADLLNLLLVGMLFVAIFQAATTGLRRLLLIHIATHADVRLLADFLRHVMSLPMRFFDLRRVGDLVSRIDENEKIRVAMVGTIPGLVLDVSLALGYLGFLAYYNSKLMLVVAAMIPVFAMMTILFTPAIRRNRKEWFAKHAEQWSYLIESLTGIATVKTMAVEAPVRWRWESLFVESVMFARREAHLENAYSTGANLLSTLASVLMLWYGARQVLADQMTIGQLIAFTVLAGNLIQPIMRLSDSWAELQDVRNAVQRLNDIFDTTPEENDSRTLLTLARIEGEIRFENVSFRYTPGQDRPTLANLSFEIRPGEKIAVVGRSGSGKTTLAKLILGLYSPTEGRVFIDGHDLKAVSRRNLRRRIGVVPQDVFLFSGTVRENIALGDPDTPFERVVAAARLAGAHDFVSEMALGYDTKVGERGMTVSGGQRQRIALARALLRDPDVLVLDEATSALDVESERAIQSNLDGACRGRTTIVIAHRLSTVRNADRIIVIDRGAIVELGTHANLLEKGGLYAHLVGQQLSL
ncbi:MAG TPA: peptidase domain-containing ABC transporter [Candidatus Binataceae bacterium]|nr:peptidase domain-containing ABC transporter [Candidatus Binataceae bacterium]